MPLLRRTPKSLSYTVQPSAVVEDTAISPAIAVAIKDSRNQTIQTATDTVVLNVASGSGTLGGSVSQAAVAGIATFSDITVSDPGSFTLGASSGALTPATSSSFDVSAGGGGELEVLLEEGFDDNEAGLAARGWYDGNSATISTSEHQGGAGSLQATMTNGQSTPSWIVKRHLFTPTDSVFVSYDVKYSTNWVGSGVNFHPHEFYLLSEIDGDWDGLSSNTLTCYIEHNWNAGGFPQLAMQDSQRINYDQGALPNDLTATHEDRSVCGCNGVVESVTFEECTDNGDGTFQSAKIIRGGVAAFSNNSGDAHYKNNWNHVECLMVMNSVVGGVSQNDGILKYWRNGTLLIDRSDIAYRTATLPTLKWKQIVIAPYMGNGSPTTQTAFYDNLIVANARTEPPVTPPAVALSFVQPPVNTLEDTVIAPPVRVGILDALGNIITSATNTVAIAKASGPGTLSGDLSNAAVAGIATFSDLQIDTPGTCTLQATSSGLTSVTSPNFDITEVTGGPSGWPNEPAGGTLVSDYGFSGAVPQGTAGGSFFDGAYDAGWNIVNHRFSTGWAGLATDATAPQSPTALVQINYPANYSSSGGEPCAIYRDVGGGTSIYIGLFWKASNPWHNHSSGVNKIWFAYIGSFPSAIVMVWRDSNKIWLTTELSTEPSTNYQPNVTLTPVNPGVWYRLECHINRSTGLTRWWVNGVLNGSHTIPYPNSGWGQFEIAPTWGGVGGANKATSDWYRIDHIRLKRL